MVASELRPANNAMAINLLDPSSAPDNPLINMDNAASAKAAKPVVLAAATHPDDIEFLFAGTLLRLADSGCEIHMWNLCNGSCGSLEQDAAATVALRLEESGESARLAGAILHPPLFADLDIFYDRKALAAVAAVVRSIQPDIVLTHSPSDYMEDHQNVCRLITSAAFSRGMPNFPTQPAVAAVDKPLALYHAPPHGLRDGLNQPAVCSHFVDVSGVMDRKCALLRCHRSQDQWLSKSQGMNAYVSEMEGMMRTLGKASGRFSHAEAWRRHNPLGFCPKDHDPLAKLLEASGGIYVSASEIRVIDPSA